MVGDDAAQEVGVGVAEGGHQFSEGLFIELPHGAKHALLRLEPSGPKIHRSTVLAGRHLVQTHNPLH